MIVKAIKSFAGLDFSMSVGEKRELDAEKAEKYIRIGYVTAEPKPKKAVLKDESKRNKC